MSVFEVAITPDGNAGSYRVEVLNSPDGGWACEVASIDVDSLLAKRHDLEVAVLLSGVSARMVFPEEHQLRDVGRVLFRALLGTGEVAGKYRAAAAVAGERREGLRVVLRLADPALAALPWEAMFDDAAGGYVCRRDQLIRHVGVLTTTTPLPVDPPLRILGVRSSPSDLPELDVVEEKILVAAVAQAAGPLAEVIWAPAATWADLQEVLLSQTWHVVHFIGHGDFDRDLGEGVLADDNGYADMVQASRLVSLLREARPSPRLVVLNSCSGAAANIIDLF